MSKNEIAPKGGEILIYQTEGGQTKIEVRLEGETLWLNQADLAKLYQTTKQNVSLHIQNIYDEEELAEVATVKEYLTVQNEGSREVSRRVKQYNLDPKYIRWYNGLTMKDIMRSLELFEVNNETN